MTNVNLRRIDAGAELTRAAHQIRVNMGFENMGDGNVLIPGQGDVFFDIGCRIEDRGQTFVVIAEQVGKFCDSLGLDAFEDE